MEINYLMMFQKIFNLFTNLRCLKLNPSSSFRDALFFYIIPETNISSTLLEFHVTVKDMDDCINILYECFDQLRILYVTVYSFSTEIFRIEHKVGYFY